MPMKVVAYDVAVIGPGPAGAATACGLRKFGYRVVLLGESRNTSIEGASERTVARLRAADLSEALECIKGPGERTGFWGSEVTAKSTEYLIERSSFDSALSRDAAAAGVDLCPVPVGAVDPRGRVWRLNTRDAVIDALFVIDARGRHARGAPLRGPPLVAVSQRFTAPPGGTVRTAIHPVDDGWIWLADDGCGTRWVQVIGAPSALHATADVPLRISAALQAVPQHAGFVENAVAVGAPTVRAAVAKMSLAAPALAMLRVGDASIAMDPLSGHGIHEALVAAHFAVAGAHTYLERDDWFAVERFMNTRAREAWGRMTLEAAHFYRAQAAHLATSFWTQAASAYESLATAANLGKQGNPVSVAVGG